MIVVQDHFQKQIFSLLHCKNLDILCIRIFNKSVLFQGNICQKERSFLFNLNITCKTGVSKKKEKKKALTMMEGIKMPPGVAIP